MRLGLALPLIATLPLQACSSCVLKGHRLPRPPQKVEASLSATFLSVSPPPYNPLWFKEPSACKSTARDSLLIDASLAMASMPKRKPEWAEVLQMDINTFGDNLISTSPCVRASGIWGLFASGHFDYGDVSRATDLSLDDPDPRVRGLATFIVQAVKNK